MSTPATPPAAKKKPFVPVLLVLFCLGGGIAAGVFAVPKSVTEPVAEEAKPVIRTPVPDGPSNAVEDAVRTGEFEKALKLLNETKPKEDGPDANGFLHGLALEGSGRHVEAVDAYRRAADPDRDPAGWAAAALGMVRCALARNDDRTARDWLARVELRCGHAGLRSTRVKDECAMLRARLDAARLPKPADPEPLDDAARAVPAFDLTGPYLDWLTDGWRKSPEESADAPPHVAITAGLTVEEELVSGLLPETRVTDILRVLARAGGWKLRLPNALDPSLSGAALPVALDGHPLADVLTALTEPVGLKWQLNDDTLTIGIADPTTPTDAKLTARSSLSRAAGLADHPHARTAAVRLGALNEDLGEAKEAAERYTKILTDAPHCPEAVYAGYNLGLHHLRAGKPAIARTVFREVIDRGGKGKWTDLGWWWTGRSHLDECDPAGALKPLRAAVNGSDRAIRSAAALGITLCHTLQGDDVAAWATLQRHRIAAAEPHSRFGQLFDDLFRHGTTPSRLRAESLLAAVGDVDGGRRLGPAGVFIVGRVYRDLGFTGKTIDLYEKAIAARGPWAPRLTLAVAEILDDEGKTEEARQRLLAVAAVDDGDVGMKAELRLTDLELRTGRSVEAVTRGAKLLDRPGADESAVLLLLGRGYEATGHPRRAAQCFAGIRPTE